MEDDTSLHDGNVGHLSRRNNLGRRVGLVSLALLLGLPSNSPLDSKFNQEREEQTSHDDGRSRALVLELPEAFIGEHHARVRVQLLAESARSEWDIGDGARTWTKAVEMMTPVPNCFRTMRNRLDLTGVNVAMRMGPKTPAAVRADLRVGSGKRTN